MPIPETNEEVVNEQAVDTIPAGELPGDDVDEDAEFAKYAAQADERKRIANGEAPSTSEPDTAVVVDTPTEPAKEGATKDAAQAATVTAPAATTPSADDEALINALPEDKRAAARKRFAAAAATEAEAARLAHSNRSMAGRVAAFQQKYEDLRKAAPASLQKAEDKKDTAAESAQWAQFKEDYPDIAKAMEAKLAEQRPAGADPSTAEMVAYVQEQRRERFLTDAWDAVESVHPGWRETGKKKEFQEWMQTSTTYQKLAASDEITDAIALFDLYDSHQLKTAPKPPVVDPKVAADAAKLAARRGAQIEGGRAAKPNAASPNQAVDLSDEDQMFAAYAKAANSRMANRNK